MEANWLPEAQKEARGELEAKGEVETATSEGLALILEEGAAGEAEPYAALGVAPPPGSEGEGEGLRDAVAHAEEEALAGWEVLGRAEPVPGSLEALVFGEAERVLQLQGVAVSECDLDCEPEPEPEELDRGESLKTHCDTVMTGLGEVLLQGEGEREREGDPEALWQGEFDWDLECVSEALGQMVVLCVGVPLPQLLAPLLTADDFVALTTGVCVSRKEYMGVRVSE